jgi:hypothetical protein
MITKEAAYKAGVEQALMDMGLMGKQAGPNSELLGLASRAVGGPGPAREAPSALHRLLQSARGLPGQFGELPAWQQALLASGAGGAAGLGVGAMTGHPGQGMATGAALGGGAVGGHELMKLLSRRGPLADPLIDLLTHGGAGVKTQMLRDRLMRGGAAGAGGIGAGALVGGLTSSD